MPEHVAYVRKAQAEGVKIAAMARTTGLSRATIYRIVESIKGEAKDAVAGAD